MGTLDSYFYSFLTERMIQKFTFAPAKLRQQFQEFFESQDEGGKKIIQEYNKLVSGENWKDACQKWVYSTIRFFSS